VVLSQARAALTSPGTYCGETVAVDV
jgi:hypothetical protein